MDAPMYPVPMIPEHDFQAQMTSNFPFKGTGDDLVSRSDMLGYSWLWIQKQELLIKTLTGFTYNLQGLEVADRNCTLDIWIQIRGAMTHFDDGLAQMRYTLERLFDEEESDDDLELKKARTDVENAMIQLDISRYSWCQKVNAECLNNNVAFYQHDTSALITPGEVLGPVNMSLLSRRSKLEKAITSWEDLGTLLRESKDYDYAYEKLTELARYVRGKNATAADHRRAYRTFHPGPQGLHASSGQIPPNFGNQGPMATGSTPIQAQQDMNGGVRHPIGRVLQDPNPVSVAGAPSQVFSGSQVPAAHLPLFRDGLGNGSHTQTVPTANSESDADTSFDPQPNLTSEARMARLSPEQDFMWPKVDVQEPDPSGSYCGCRNI